MLTEATNTHQGVVWVGTIYAWDKFEGAGAWGEKGSGECCVESKVCADTAVPVRAVDQYTVEQLALRLVQTHLFGTEIPSTAMWDKLVAHVDQTLNFPVPEHHLQVSMTYVSDWNLVLFTVAAAEVDSKTIQNFEDLLLRDASSPLVQLRVKWKTEVPRAAGQGNGFNVLRVASPNEKAAYEAHVKLSISRIAPPESGSAGNQMTQVQEAIDEQLPWGVSDIDTEELSYGRKTPTKNPVRVSKLQKTVVVLLILVCLSGFLHAWFIIISKSVLSVIIKNRSSNHQTSINMG